MKNSYQVFIADNFHYQDETENYKSGDFDSFEEAVNACKKIVDEYLQRNYKAGATADELYQNYINFGEDPFIVGEPALYKFSAWNYAKKRCSQICGEN